MRVFGIILLGYFTHNRLAAVVDHLIYGWIFFSAVMLSLLAAGWPWREFQAARPAVSHEATFRSTTSMQAAQVLVRGNSSVWPVLFWAVAGIVLVALGPVSARLINRGPADGTVRFSAPSVLPPWTNSSTAIGEWKPQFIEATSELKHTYASEGRSVYLYMALYGGGPRGRKLVSSINVISKGQGWTHMSERSRIVALDGEAGSVHEITLRSAEANLLVRSWYWVDGTFTDNSYWAKLLRVKALLFGGPQASAFLAVGAHYMSDQTEAASTLQDFLHHTSFREFLNRASK